MISSEKQLEKFHKRIEKMDKQHILDLVLKAFTKTPDSYMRSIDGVVLDTGLNPQIVKQCLDEHPELFRYAPVVAPSSGSTIYHHYVVNK